MKHSRCGWMAVAMVIISVFSAQLVFATEYADPARGFSISYPNTFMVAKPAVPEIFFVTDPANYPWITVGVWKAPDFISAIQAHMNGWTSFLKTDKVGETTTQDGTKASLVKVKYVVQGWDAEGLAIGIQRGDEWAIAEYSTVPPYGVVDEPNYLKALQTLKLTK